MLVVALTDAPRNPAEQRVKRLGLDVHLTSLYTMPGFTFPETGLTARRWWPPTSSSSEARGDYRAACPVIELPRDLEKPNPAGLKRILDTYAVRPQDCLVVGDSLNKDVAVARALGCHDAWAEYGTYHPPEYRERLDIISSNAITRRHAAHLFEGGHQKVVPTHRLSNYEQVLELVAKLGG